jgi:hypothetical protein
MQMKNLRQKILSFSNNRSVFLKTKMFAKCYSKEIILWGQDEKAFVSSKEFILELRPGLSLGELYDSHL